MSALSSLLGKNQLAGNFRLEFQVKNERVAAKLYQADRKQGVFYLEGVSVDSPLSYENLPEFAQSKIDDFLTLYNLKINPERVSKTPPLGTPGISISSSSSPTPVILPGEREPEHTSHSPEVSCVPYVASLKGPFIGSFPVFINSKLVLATSQNAPYGAIRLYDLEKNELVSDMPVWNVSLQEPPLYKNSSNGQTEVITGWDSKFRGFITSPQEPVGTKYTSSFTPEGTLKITTPNQVHELKKAVSCCFVLEDYIDPDDYGPYPKKLVCYDHVIMGETKVAILKGSGELHIWDLNSNSKIHVFSQEELLKYGLASQDSDDDQWYSACSFQRDKLLARKSSYSPETSRFNIELFQFEFNPFRIKEHRFDKEEAFKEIFDDKVFTIYQQNLYSRKLCTDEPRQLFMQLGFNPKRTYNCENFLVLVTENDDIFLIDLRDRTRTPIIPPASPINFQMVHKIKFIDGCLFLIEDSFEFKTFGFKLHSFDFSPQNASASAALYETSPSQANLPSYYKENRDLESRLAHFILHRTCTVGWDPTKTLVFLADLKEKFPKEAVRQELIQIICDNNHLIRLFPNTNDRPLIPCFAAYILKELDALPSNNIQVPLSKGLEALEETYQLGCPAKDTALRDHFSDIRREAVAAFKAMVTFCPKDEMPSLIASLNFSYTNLNESGGPKNTLSLIAFLIEAAKQAS